MFFTFGDTVSRDTAKHNVLTLRSGAFISLSEATSDTITITLKELPIEVTDQQILAYISKFATVKDGVTHGFIVKINGDKSRVMNGNRYVQVSEIKASIPNNPTIGGFLCRLNYRGQPCSTCNNTVGHAWYKCPQREKPKCFNCKLATHFDCLQNESNYKNDDETKEKTSWDTNTDSHPVQTPSERDNTVPQKTPSKPGPTERIVVGCSIARGVYSTETQSKQSKQSLNP